MRKAAMQRCAEDKTGNLARHQHGCRVCAHPEREQIEQEWVNWANTTRLAKRYRLSRDSLYRHAAALGLFEKRARNVKRALERLIERAETVPVTASAVVQAIATYARINSEGRLVERTERVNLNELFARMSTEELESYAREGRLPAWFTSVVGATEDEGRGGETDG